MKQTSESKMYAVADHLNQLNLKKEVKAFTANERGYAKIIQVKPGCSVWFHHCLDDSLTIDMTITPVAERRHANVCKAATTKFKEIFKGQVVHESWQHSTGDRPPDKKISVNVSKNTLQEILSLITSIKKIFA